MSKKSRLRALVGLTYPVGESVGVISKAKGIRNLSPEQYGKLTMKRVEAGGWCDDLPVNDRKPFLSAGKIERVKIKESD